MTTSPATPETVLHAEPSEADQFSALRERLDAIFHGRKKAYLVSSDGGRVELPASAVEALKLMIDAMARGQSIVLVPRHEELTSQEAADFLHVSRPHLIKLLDRGEIPFHRVGSHRRIKAEDVLAFRDRRDAERDATLNELTRLSEELPGGYK